MPRRKQDEPEVLKDRLIFGRNLRRARRDADLTQNQLTTITGLTQAFISDVENGKSTVSLDNANALAKAVKQSLSKLLSKDKE